MPCKTNKTENRNANLLEYQRRINQVIDYITDHLAENLTLARLAQVAFFSPFHFHRVFKSMTGENLFESIQRLRMQKAASILRYPSSQSMLEIALDCGFSGASTFARAFKACYGMSATEWKNGGALRWERRKNRSNLSKQLRSVGKASPRTICHPSPGTAGANRLNQEEKDMKVTIEELPSYRIAYMRHVGPYGPSGIPELWRRFEKWMDAHGLTAERNVTLGISHDDPHVTDAGKCRYDACVVVTQDFEGDALVNVSEVPGGKYACSEFTGTAHEIEAAWDDMFRCGIPGTGFQPDDRPCFELYPPKATADAGKVVFRCKLCVPVRPL